MDERVTLSVLFVKQENDTRHSCVEPILCCPNE